MTATTAPTSTSSPSSTGRRERRVEGLVPERTVLGISLLAIGLVVFGGLVVPDLDRYTLLLVSAVCLIAFAFTREYGFAVPAGITGGLGTMVLVTTSVTNDPLVTGSAFFLCIAGGFISIWLLGLVAQPRATHPWPLVPATVLGIMGLAVLTKTPSAVDWLTAGIALALVAGGTALVLRHRSSGETPA
jgi:hypothetical protein